MMLRLCNFIFFVYKDNGRVEVLHFGWLDPCFSKDNNFVARLEMSSWRAIKADITFPAFARHNICLPKNAIREVGNIYILEWPHTCGFDEVFVYRYRADIIQFGLGNGRPMDFGHANSNQHDALIVV